MCFLFKKVLALVLVTVFASQVGAQRRDVFSQPNTNQTECINSLPAYKEFNAMWQAGLTKAYMLGQSQRTGARTVAMHVTGNATKDACLITNPCIVHTPTDHPLLWTAKACNNASQDRAFAFVPGSGFTVKISDGRTRWNFFAREIMTDEKSYYLMYDCYEDGTKGYSLVSIKRSLSNDVIKQISERLDADGFNRSERSILFMDDVCPPEL